MKVGAIGIREDLVPVHNEPGAVVFRYDVLPALGGGSASTAPKLEQPAAAEAQPELQQDEEPMPDYLDLDFDAVEDAKPSSNEPEPEDGDIVEDFIALGEDTAVPAPSAAVPDGPELLKQVPWLPRLRGIRSPLLKLHQEIVEFCRYLEPSPEEAAQRQAAISRIQSVVQAIWPQAELQVFGSFATGLYLPTSDVDAVIMGSGCDNIPAGLKALATSLARKGLAKNMQVIAKARVPIVKFEEAESGYNFDISFDLANGPEAAANVRAMMDCLPPMRPLLMVLKVFLQQRELNEVYSGGLGSYALLVMVAAFLLLHPSRHAASAAGGGSSRRGGGSKAHRSGGGGQTAGADIDGSLGVLLVDFFRLFGRSLNHHDVGISCRKGGMFFSKRARGFYQEDRQFMLSVEDPNDTTNDLGKNSYNIQRVRMAFEFAYCQLVAPCEPQQSLLQRVIRLDPVLFLRAPPADYPDSPRPTARKQPQQQQQQRGQGQGEEGGEQQALSKRERRAERKKERRKEQREQEREERKERKRKRVGEGEEGSPPPEQQQEEEEERQEKERGGKKRKHRERSQSDDDLDGGSSGRWQMAQEDAAAGEEVEHGPEEQRLQRQGVKWQNGSAGGGGRGSARSGSRQKGRHTSQYNHEHRKHHHRHHESSRQQQQQHRNGGGRHSSGRGGRGGGGGPSSSGGRQQQQQWDRGGSNGTGRWSGGQQQRHIRFD